MARITARPLAFALALLAGAGAARLASAQAAPRAHYDFEDGTQGFTAIRIKGGQPEPDPDGTLTAPKDKALAHQGEGVLAMREHIEPGTVRLLGADLRLPQRTKSLRLWAKSDVRTGIILGLREEDGSNYQATYLLAANAWTEIALNLDEMGLEENSTDENGRLDADQIRYVSILDMSTIFANFGDPNALIANYKPDRTLWLDDLQFSTQEAPRSRGPVKTDAGEFVVLDNFEGSGVRWNPVQVSITPPPSFKVFPDLKLELSKENPAPGLAKTPVEPGGKALRMTYNREKQTAYAINIGCAGLKLDKADRLLISTNMSRPSVLIIQIKEKGGAEYNFNVLPEGSVGWTNRVLDFSSFTLGDNSKDNNGKLDGDQIKEVTILDASAFLGDQIPGGETTMQLDALAFGLAK